jgi:hypothetical protein
MRTSVTPKLSPFALFTRDIYGYLDIYYDIFGKGRGSSKYFCSLPKRNCARKTEASSLREKQGKNTNRITRLNFRARAQQHEQSFRG